ARPIRRPRHSKCWRRAIRLRWAADMGHRSHRSPCAEVDLSLPSQEPLAKILALKRLLITVRPQRLPWNRIGQTTKEGSTKEAKRAMRSQLGNRSKRSSLQRERTPKVLRKCHVLKCDRRGSLTRRFAYSPSYDLTRRRRTLESRGQMRC